MEPDGDTRPQAGTRIHVELLDGRIINLSDLTIIEMIALLDHLGVTEADIKVTTHYLPRGTL